MRDGCLQRDSGTGISPVETQLKSARNDFERLEQAVRMLVQQARELRAEKVTLNRELAARDRVVRELEERLLDARQLRHDAIKRIDDLLSQVDNLDAHLAASSIAARD